MFFGAALLAASLSTASPTQPLERLIPSKRYTLKNGLRVILHEDHSQPLVAVRVLYEVGRRHDPPGQQGMTHLLEHNLFGLTKHLEVPVWTEMARMHAIGVNGTTEDDSMQLFEVVPSTSVRAAIRLEADRMGHARLDAEVAGDEVRIIVRELAERRDDLQWGAALQTALRNLYPPTHPLHPSSGESLARITIADLREFERWSVTPNNAVLVLAGDLPSDTEERIEQYFGRLLPGPDISEPGVPHVELSSTVRKEIRGAAGTEPLALLVWPLREEDVAIGLVVHALLERRFRRRDALRIGSRSGVLRNLALPLDSSGRTFGIASIGGHGAAPAALEAELRAALVELLEHPPTTREIDVALQRWRVALLSGLDSFARRAELLASSEAGDVRSPKGVEPEHVRQFVDARLLHAPSLVILQTPPDDR